MAFVLLLSCSHASAEPSLTPLLKSLDLVGYPSRSRPPDFTADTIDTRQVSMGTLRGHVVLVNFWASWCAECRPEMSELERMYRQFASRGLIVVAVNAREEKETIRRYARELDLTFPLVLDPKGTINAHYGVIGLPTTFVVGRDGHAVAFGVGPRHWEGAAAHALIETLLAERVKTPDPR